MLEIREIYRQAFADAWAENTQGGPMSPAEAREARDYAREYAENELEAAWALRGQGCPVGHLCESCGGQHEDLRVVTVDTTVGQVCVTTCSTCIPAAPRTARALARFVAQHRLHRERA